MIKSYPFLIGLFLICLSSLTLQIGLTRLVSVIAYFHLTFLCISLAMLGLTAGAVWVYRQTLAPEAVMAKIGQLCLLYGATALAAPLFILLIPLSFASFAQSALALLGITAILSAPFFYAGAIVTLCLMRVRDSSSISLRYGVDLCGAALGCLVAVLLFEHVATPAALMLVGLLPFVARLCFVPAKTNPVRPLALILGGAALILASATSPQLYVDMNKNVLAQQKGSEIQLWNSHSLIALTPEFESIYAYWGMAKDAPQVMRPMKLLTIDGMAATPMYRAQTATVLPPVHLYDVTNLAYATGRQGHAGIIGIGGGRDALAARAFGLTQVTVIEMNQIIVDLLTRIQPYKDYAGLAADPAITFHVDEARSWFARTSERFDLIQMSLVDTFAATGSGAFTLSENGLYTIEGWVHFLSALKPQGLFTVSRYFSPSNLDEAARTYTLAMASLFRLGATMPAQHIYMASVDNIATLVVGRDPLTAADIERLDTWSAQRGYTVLARPGELSSQAVLQALSSAQSEAQTQQIASGYPLDLQAPDDDRPFFFNQLRLRDLWQSIDSVAHQGENGVVSGNIRATLTLLAIIGLSLVAIMALLVLPTYSAVAKVEPSLARAGTSYFLLIGLGFMLVEMALIQRLSLFLGHPTYALAIVLFSLILLTGLGSFASGRLALSLSRSRLVGYILLLTLTLTALAYFMPLWLAAYEASSLFVRAVVALCSIAPAAFLMGFAFPVGLDMAARQDARPTPWFWAINGAAGVLATGLAVLISMNFGISSTLYCGAFAYFLLLIPALQLQRKLP
jgi:hypothetical protein